MPLPRDIYWVADDATTEETGLQLVQTSLLRAQSSSPSLSMLPAADRRISELAEELCSGSVTMCTLSRWLCFEVHLIWVEMFVLG